MSRVQLALRVSDLEGSIAFYRSLFGVEPAKPELGLFTQVENDTTCCYALQDKVWVHGPGAEPWEVYTVKADAPEATSIHPVGISPTAAAGDCLCGSPMRGDTEPYSPPVVAPWPCSTPSAAWSRDSVPRCWG